MGLSVVHGIVSGMGGNIRVLSEPGKGTQVFIYLPVTDPGEEQTLPGNAKPVAGGTESILLVDDEADIIEMEKQLLERLGYRVHCFLSPEKALAAFRSRPEKYDLAITDMTMPGITGDIPAKEMMAVQPDLPVIICTGFSERINAEKAAVLGIKNLLLKPVEKSELAQTVREALEAGTA